MFMDTQEPAPLEVYAVIFRSQRTPDESGYETMSEKMLALAKAQPGFIDVISSRSKDGFGITVSYWDSIEAIQLWKKNVSHAEAQLKGRSTWYEFYQVEVCKVLRSYKSSANY